MAVNYDLTQMQAVRDCLKYEILETEVKTFTETSHENRSQVTTS